MIRPVAHGLRLSSPVSTTSATGYVHVCICAARTTKTTWDFLLVSLKCRIWLGMLGIP